MPRLLANTFHPLARRALLTGLHRFRVLMHAKLNREVRGQNHLLLTPYVNLLATLCNHQECHPAIVRECSSLVLDH